MPTFPLTGPGSFGAPRAGHPHNGIDLGAPIGTPIYAAAPGVVRFATVAYMPGFSGYGRTVVLDADDGTHQLHGHMDRVAVAPGARVAAGTILGTVGRTAFTKDDPTALTSGPHLHYEVSATPYPQTQYAPRLDPVAYLTARGMHPLRSPSGLQPAQVAVTSPVPSYQPPPVYAQNAPVYASPGLVQPATAATSPLPAIRVQATGANHWIVPLLFVGIAAALVLASARATPRAAA